LKLPPELLDVIREALGAACPVELPKHCRREMFQGGWRILLDDELVDAYEIGFEYTFWDGVTRRVFIRIFTYSADYKEK
jgi:hypothetical protein